MTRYLLLYQKRDGTLVGNPRDLYREAPSITKALEGTPPRDHLVDSAWVLPVGDEPGKRVPIHHRSPKWAPSNEWGDVTPT